MCNQLFHEYRTKDNRFPTHFPTQEEDTKEKGDLFQSRIEKIEK